MINLIICRSLTLSIRQIGFDIRNAQKAAANQKLIEEIRDWLRSPDPSTNLFTAGNKRHESTGNWLLESSSFTRWQHEACSFLWLYGKAGSGKTVLSSTVVQSLTLQVQNRNAAIAYFYFDFQSRDKQLFQGVLNSVILQISWQNIEALELLKDLYNVHSRGLSRPNLKDLKLALRQMIERSKSLYIIVDALDECLERQDLLQFLSELRSWNSANTHVFVTSRKEEDIKDVLNPLATHQIPLEESVIQEDIATYVKHHVQNDYRLSKWTENVRNDIENALLKGAKGMFRWVECQLDALRGCMKLGSLRHALVSLPKTLDETYSRILNGIREEYLLDAHRILSLLIYSYHPLDLNEVSSAIPIVTDGEVYFDPDNLLYDARDVLSICSSFVSAAKGYRLWGPSDVSYEPEFEELRLAHFSVKEYLTSTRTLGEKPANFGFEEGETHEYIAALCIRFMLGSTRTEWMSAHPEHHEFAPYAASFWSYHFQTAGLNHSSSLYLQCIDMLSDSYTLATIMKLRRYWFGGRCDHPRSDLTVTVQCSNITGSNEHQDREVGEILPGAVSPLLYLSLLGLDDLIVTFLEKGECVDSYGPQGTCLSGAAFAGHLSTVKLLIEKGANVNGRVCQTLFITTDDLIDEDTVTFGDSAARDTDPDDSTVNDWTDGDSIIDHSSTNNFLFSATAGYSRTAIHSAVESGQGEIVKILLDHGADVNLSRAYLKDNGNLVEHNTPLQAAVYSNDHALVRLLLTAGADPNAYRGDFVTVLETVSEITDRLDLMIMLLDGGANPNIASSSSYPKPPLYRAIVHGNRPCAELLIRRGADPALIDSRIVTDIISKILGYEAPGVRPGDFPQAVKMLLDLHPDFSLENLLLPAIKYGHIDIVRLLLQHGVSPDTQDSDHVAALHAAAFEPFHDHEMVKLLLDAGADVNIHGGPFGSALQAASLKAQVGAVRLLLESGAFVNCAVGQWGSALMIARDRLEDQKMGRQTDHTSGTLEAWPGYTSDYLPEAWVENVSGPNCSDENALIDIEHHSSADYQTVIEVLLAYGAQALSEEFNN